MTPPGSRRSSPRCAPACSRARSAIAVERHVEVERHGRRREHVRQVAEAEERRLAGTFARGRRDRGHAVAPRCSTRVARTSASAIDAEGHDAAREPSARAITRGSSALATSTSVGPRSSRISALASAMASADRRTRGARRRRWSTRGRRVPRCRPACGSRPGWFMPSSTTATSDRRAARAARAAGRCGCSGSPCSGTRGSARTGNSAATSLVVVLPALPVIATTFAPATPPHLGAPVLQRPRRVATSITTAPAGAASAAARGPARRPRPRERVGDELVAVEPLAANRDEQSPGCSVRESIDARPTARRSPRTIRPPVAAATSAGGQRSRSTATTPATPTAPRKRRARDFDVVERQRPVADDLVFLVPLAGDEHEVAAARVLTARSIAALRSTIARYGVAFGACPPLPTDPPAARCRA